MTEALVRRSFTLLTALLLLSTLADGAGIQTPDQTCRVRNVRGELVRSAARRAQFLRGIGYKDSRAPAGYCVDHVVPLVCGGCDLPSNMALMDCKAMRVKDDAMRVRAKAPLCNVPMGPLPAPPGPAKEE